MKFLENSYTFYVRQIILPNIVLLRSSLTRNVQVVHQREIGKVRQAKQIKSTQVYDKCNQIKLNFVPFLPHGLGP